MSDTPSGSGPVLPTKSEAEARCEIALRWAVAARGLTLASMSDADRMARLYDALDAVIRILGGGKQS